MKAVSGKLEDVLCTKSLFKVGTEEAELLCSKKYFVYIMSLSVRASEKITIDDKSYLYPFMLIARAFQMCPDLHINVFIRAKPTLQQFIRESLELPVVCETLEDKATFQAVVNCYSFGIRRLFSTLSLEEWRENFQDLYWLIQQGFKLTKRLEQVNFSHKDKDKDVIKKIHHEVAIHTVNMLLSQITLLMANEKYTQVIRPALDLLEIVKNLIDEQERRLNAALAHLMLAIVEAKENLLASACKHLLHAFECEKNIEYSNFISPIQSTTGYLDTSLQCANYCVEQQDIKSALVIFQSSLKSSKKEFLKYRELQIIDGGIFPDPGIEKKYDDLKEAYHNFILAQFLSLEKFNDVFLAVKIIRDQNDEHKLTFKFHNDKVFPENIKKQTEEIKVANNYFSVKLTRDFKLEKFLKIIQEIIGHNQPPIVEVPKEVLASEAQMPIAIVGSSDAPVLLETSVTDLKIQEPSEAQKSAEVIGSTEAPKPNQTPASSSPSQKNLSKGTSKKETRGDENRLNKISHVTVPKVVFWKNLGVSYSNVDSTCGVVPLSRGRGEQQLISEGIWYGTISKSVANHVAEVHLGRLLSILKMGNFVGRHGQGVKWLKQPIFVGGSEYIVELKTCGQGERGTQRLYGRIADTADLTNEQGKIQHPKLIVFDAFSEDGHKQGIKFCR